MTMEEIEKEFSEIQGDHRNISTGIIPSLQIIPLIQAGRINKLDELMKDLEYRCSELKVRIDSLINSAKKNGYEEGFAQSLEKTIKLVSEAEKIKREAIQDASDKAMDMALNLSAKVIRNQVEIRPELLLQFIKEWTDSRESPEQIEIHMNPSDIERLRKRKSIPVDSVITPDDDLPEGGCVIEANGYIIDAGINARLDCILNEANKPS